MDKREFIKSSGAAALLISMGISLESCTSEVEDPGPVGGGDPVTIDISTSAFASLQNNDGWALDGSNKILLVNINGNISAFSSVCPHAGCSTDWAYSNEKFTCLCHSSVFSNTGNKLSGPANKGLKKLTVVQEGDILTITG